MKKPYHVSQISPVGWYLASYLQRIDPVSAYETDDPSHEPWVIWENRILVNASNPDEALEKARQQVSNSESEYTNSDGVMLRGTVVGLTSLIPIYEALEDGNEIEWRDHSGETLGAMRERIVKDSELEAFTLPENSDPEESD